MKKVIANKVYDTETAELVASYHDKTCAERLYRKRTGEFSSTGAAVLTMMIMLSGKGIE